jgi:hypothetical protein
LLLIFEKPKNGKIEKEKRRTDGLFQTRINFFIVNKPFRSLSTGNI